MVVVYGSGSGSGSGSGIIVFEAQSGSAWSSVRSSAGFEAGQYSSIGGQTSSVQLSSAEFKTGQRSSIGVQTSSIRFNAAQCNSAELNAAQYSTIQIEKVLNTIMFWTVCELYDEFQRFVEIPWNSILKSYELTLLESGWTVSMLGATPSPERSEGRARQKMNISSEHWSNCEIRLFKFQLALLDSFHHNALPVLCQERFRNCAYYAYICAKFWK